MENRKNSNRISVATRTLLLATLLVATSACGKVSLNIDGMTPGSGFPFLRLSKGAEFVASAQQGEQTLNGYRVDTTVGSVYSKLEAQTPNGYKVYSTVQGHLVADEKMKSAAASATH